MIKQDNTTLHYFYSHVHFVIIELLMKNTYLKINIKNYNRINFFYIIYLYKSLKIIEFLIKYV